MRIVLLVEGNTESFQAVSPQVFAGTPCGENAQNRHDYLRWTRTKRRQLGRVVDKLLTGGNPADAVIALSDVYTGQRDFADAADAKAHMNAAVDKKWLGNSPKFFAHVALHDFEAWLLPFWKEIQALAQHNKSSPTGQPETVNHTRPPSSHIKEIFSIGKVRSHYVKPRDARRILDDAQRSRRENVLLISANACPELKAFLNTILRLCGGEELV